MRLFRIFILPVALLLLTACQAYRYDKVQGEERRLVDAETGKPVAGAKVEVWIYNVAAMKREGVRKHVSSTDGRFVIPREQATGLVLPATGVRTSPREQSYHITADGYLPLHLGLWVTGSWQPLKPGRTLKMFPDSSLEALPETFEFSTQYLSRGDQEMFLPTTRIGGGKAITLLGVLPFRPIVDVFEKAKGPETIDARLDGATVQPVIPESGAFVDWPDQFLLYLAFEDGTDVGGWLISQGLAISDFRFEHDKAKDYERLEDEATAAGRGVWGVLKRMGAGS